MRRAALALGLVLLVAAAAVWGVPYLTRDRDLLAVTPQPDPLYRVATIRLRGDQRACMDRVVVDAHSEQARFRVGTYGKAAVPLALSIDGGGYHASARVPARYADSQRLRVPVTPPARPVQVTVCIANGGHRAVALYAAAGHSKSRSRVRVDGRRVRANFDLLFAERRPASIADRMPVSLRRASAFRPSVVSPATLWPLLVLFAIGVPVALVATFARSLRDDR